MTKKIPLHMQPEAPSENGDADGTALSPAEPGEQPIIGWLAVGCGLLGVFSWGIIFVPMGLAFSIAAIIAGQAAWGFAGLVLAVVGFFSSPTLMTIAGLGAIAAFFGIPGF